MALVQKRPVIATTGSSRKTTIKEMIASILGRRWRIFKSRQNWPLNQVPPLWSKAPIVCIWRKPSTFLDILWLPGINLNKNCAQK